MTDLERNAERMTEKTELPPIELLTETEILAQIAMRDGILERVKCLNVEAKEIADRIGLSEMEWVDHIDGTNCADWRCKRCGGKFVGSKRGICPVCRPFKAE